MATIPSSSIKNALGLFRGRMIAEDGVVGEPATAQARPPVTFQALSAANRAAWGWPQPLGGGDLTASATAGAQTPDLRMKVIRAAGKFYWARSAYFIAIDQHGRGEGLSEAAEAARLAAGVYRAALDELRVRLLSSQRSAEDAAEVGRVSKLITMIGDEAG